MSMLPFAPSNVAARAATRAASPARPEAGERSERSVQIERSEPSDKTERTERAFTPPDFAALLALLAGNSTPASARDVVNADALFLNGDATATVEESAAESSDSVGTGVLDNERPVETAPSAGTVAGTSGTTATTGMAFTDSDQRALARSIRADALRVAQALIADTNRGTEFTNDTASLRNATPGSSFSENELFSLAERARGSGVGELLARGDAQAAGLRSRIDAVLDMAGTPRGRALAESARPAFAAAVTRSASDVSTAVRDLDALAPEFKGRLDRVIDRMRDEFGHDVQVVETVRSTERQDHLFAQGRTRQGPVVTWTTESAHLSGEAADVIIDGKWHNPQGYARLHEIAKEEGLRTLGMRDPGHLEMPGASRGALNASAAARDNASGFDRGMAHNGVAGVAAVARVAQVAAVAQVARPGSSGMRTNSSASRSTASFSEASLPGTANSANTARGDMSALSGGEPSAHNLPARGQSASHQNAPDHSSRDRNRDSLTERERNAVSAVERASERGMERASERSAIGGEPPSAIGSLGASVERVLDGGVPRVAAPVGSNASARAEAIAVLREDAPAKSINSLTMQIDSPNGAEEIRVSLRGGTVGAQINTTDNALAERLRLQTADLADALSRHGLENEPLRVQQNARAQDNDATRLGLADRGELLKTNSAAAGQQTGQHTSQQQQQEPGARDRGAARQQPERDARDARDDTHQQGRRNDRQENR